MKCRRISRSWGICGISWHARC